MRSERLTFTGAFGDELAARLDLPDGPPRAFALFAHCFTCGKDIFAASRIARALADRDIAVLRFDVTGLGHSEGEFANTNFSSNVDDLIAAADTLRERYMAPSLLIGHSLGGAAVLTAAERVPEVRAVATVGAPADPAHVAHLFEDAREEIEAQGEAEVQLAGRPFRVKQQFFEDLTTHSQAERVKAMRAALLVMHAPLDATVGIDNATAIFIAARHPKSFISLDTADHLITKRADAVYAGAVIAAWAERYLEPAAEAPQPAVADEGTVIVSETGEGRFTQAITAGRHHLAADEPASYGGDNTGPSPYDLLLTALGACTTMTLRMYANRKKLPLDRASVTLTHAKTHAEDCAECETTEGKINRIERAITLEGDLDAEQRASLIRIADKCPVHRTLHSEVVVDTREAG